MTAVAERPLTLTTIPTDDLESCRWCGQTLPWDEEVACDPCRSTHKMVVHRCCDCRSIISEDEEYCDDCRPSYCEACNSTYDAGDEGNDEYCGTCYAERYCSDCDAYCYEEQYDGLCASCAVTCNGCKEPQYEDDLDEGYCYSCRDERTCEECNEFLPDDTLVLQVCTTCREAEESEEGE